METTGIWNVFAGICEELGENEDDDTYIKVLEEKFVLMHQDVSIREKQNTWIHLANCSLVLKMEALSLKQFHWKAVHIKKKILCKTIFKMKEYIIPSSKMYSNLVEFA